LLLNKKRADAFLEKYNIDALVSSSRENTSYLTNFLSVEHVFTKMYGPMPGSGENFTQVYGVYPKNGTPILIIPSSLYMIMSADESVTEEVFTYGKGISLVSEKIKLDSVAEKKFQSAMDDPKTNFENPGVALAHALTQNSNGRNLAVDLSDMLPASVGELERSGFQVRKANELFRFIRMVKSDEEVSRLAQAAEINEKGMQRIFDLAKTRKKKPVTEKELGHEYLTKIASLGGTSGPAWVMIPTGSRGGAMTSPTASKLSADKKMFWIDVSCSFLGYHADTGESASLGKPSEIQKKRYDAVLDAVGTSEEILTPGMKPSELNTSITKVFEKHGIPRPPTGMGHGIGLEVYDYPRISAAKGDAISNPSAIKDDFIQSSIDIPFEEGMVLALEAPYLMWGWGGVHAEVTVLLGKSQTRRLVRKQKRFLREV
jgi:Xaa-Pro dipeptidase